MGRPGDSTSDVVHGQCRRFCAGKRRKGGWGSAAPSLLRDRLLRDHQSQVARAAGRWLAQVESSVRAAQGYLAGVGV